ncbi:YcaO-like family protein [Deinococcus cellulosilyticus]|uniref:YcaO domain-containing protein n=1 Tax=Deinococcus cellulosilyticus (strain DSM 18568 / NBRC 106333 / KACC 11606 / 5516J-15) TaxID=1223518 RepID=A0A511N220_DEIC1|nr:YcaO-like family protein [Deinococcus cellulosilyticus]GEM46893.1 hypothetical protein DC3_25280 [Deinococcus cellulosilyticus NBRC 106333 = KACC 11606]
MPVLNPDLQTKLYRNGPHLYFCAGLAQHENTFTALADLLGRDFDASPVSGHPFLDTLVEELQGLQSGLWRIQLPDLHLEHLPLHVAGFNSRPLDLETPQFERHAHSCRNSEVDDTLLKMLLRAERWPVEAMPVFATAISLQGQTDFGIGRGSTAKSARTSALLEALERRSAVFQGRHHVTRARPEDLPGRHLGREMLTQLDHEPEFSTATDWVEGWSLRHQQRIFIPAREVFMGYHRDEGILNASSSGCALGSSLEEALLHGLFELIERDAFLLNWYSRSPVASLDLTLCMDSEVQGMLLVAGDLGYQVQAFDTTTENGVPAVWVMAKGKGEGQIHSFSSLGAHMDPLRALRGALQELLVSLELYPPSFDPTRAKLLLDHPEQVESGFDHFLFYAHFESQKWLDFLPDPPHPEALRHFLDRRNHWKGADVVQKLTLLLQTLLDHHPDVAFVDLTTPGLSALGLCAVRAVVPGLLPMTFGFSQQRTRNNPRLQAALQRNRTRLPEAPHPFP